MLKKSFQFCAFAVLMTLISLSQAHATVFSDSFEGNTLDPFWWDLYGTTSLSNDIAHTGNQSLKTPPGSGLVHDWGMGMENTKIGNISIWMYDDLTPQNHSFYLSYRDQYFPDPDMKRIGVGVSDDFGTIPYHNDPTIHDYYNVRLDYGWYATDVIRTKGWHKFEFEVNNNGSNVKVDDKNVFFTDGFKYFNSLSVGADSFPFNDPSATFYADDFHVNATVTPEPISSALFLLGGGFIAVRLRRNKK